MSNSRKLPGAKKERPRCGSCNRHAGSGAIQLRDGQVICLRCRDAGALSRVLPCGHIGIPGTTVISDSADHSNFQCIRCSPHAGRSGTVREFA